MSTIPKEMEEKMKHAIKAYYLVGNQVHENLAYNIMQYGYQLATDGREGHKQMEEISYENIKLKQHIERLQSQCTEKEREIERLKNASIDEEQKWWKQFDENLQQSKQIKELKAENERLANFYNNVNDAYENCEEDWMLRDKIKTILNNNL